MELLRPNFILLGFVVVALAALSAVAARDLRPSDHGLEYQDNTLPPAQSNQTQEMLSFFGDTPRIELPEAENITDSRQWKATHSGAGRDHLRLGLLLSSAVCGLTGIVLLVISGFIFILRRRNKPDSELPPSTSVPEGKVVEN